MKHLMLSLGKAFIFDEICAKFDTDTIKAAREVIFKLTSTDRYVYQGPNGIKSPRERSIHALEAVYSKLNELDQVHAGHAVMFVCPSHDLHLLLNMPAQCDHKVDNERFLKLESDVSSLKNMQASFEDLKLTVLALKSKPELLPNSSRVSSSANPVFSAPNRARSDSVRSVKRNLSTDSGEDKDGFSIPKNQMKKNKRRKTSGVFASDVDKVAVNNSTSRKQGTWGKSSDSTSNDFGGTVPDCFLYNCTLNTTAEGIIKNLGISGIKVKSADLKSPDNAQTLSYRVSLETMVDFDNLMSGVYIPKRMKVREFIHFRRRLNGKNQVNNSTKKASYVYHSKPMVSEFNAHSTYQKAINDLQYQKAINDLDELSDAVIDPSVNHSSASNIVSMNITSSNDHSISNILASNDLSSVCHHG